jgi:hypothetical protein
MTSQRIERDERTVAVENAGYKWAYLLLSYGLLVSVAFRSFVRHESSWDLLALVLAGGLVNALYQGARRVLYPRWFLMAAVTVVLAAVLAFASLYSGTAR